MRYVLAIAAFVLAAIGPAVAQAPRGSPPIFKIVASTEPAKGQIVFNDLVYKIETREEKRKELRNGIEVEVTVKVNVMVPILQTVVIDVTQSRVITPDGKQLPIEDVWKRVKANTVVIMSADNNTPDPAYLRALNPETVVIIPGLPKKE